MRALKLPKTQQEVQNVPLLEPDLFGACAGLRSDELLQVSDGVIRVAFNSDLLSKTIVTNHLDHALNKRDTETDSTNVCVQRNRLKTGEWCGGGCRRSAPSHPTLPSVQLPPLLPAAAGRVCSSVHCSLPLILRELQSVPFHE